MNRHDVDWTALPDAQDRAVLRERLRRFFEAQWPAEDAIRRGAQPAVIRDLWQGLAEQGLAALVELLLNKALQQRQQIARAFTHELLDHEVGRPVHLVAETSAA